MAPTPRRIARRILVFIVVLAILSAVAIWLELGPVMHSQVAAARL